ncbi:MAG: hypothetical protein HQL90_12120 [Magnetococcales bacterium]|nr:hypothetical protein [Magnetococcales bacterium]
MNNSTECPNFSAGSSTRYAVDDHGTFGVADDDIREFLREGEHTQTTQTKGEPSATMWGIPLKGIDQIFAPPKPSSPKLAVLRPEQIFDGVVLTVDKENQTFWARLMDRTGSMADEEAEFSFDEISTEDQPLIIPNALFSWHIARKEHNRQTSRVSEIRFQRLPRFIRLSPDVIARSAKRAAELKKLIAESYGYPAVNTSQA